MMYPVMDSKPELIEIDKEKEKQARENHCEIERRRRVKMAAYFNELCSMVPTCNTLQRKPDKLTILRMASSHMRSLRGHHQVVPNDNSYKPSFLTDQELKHLILEAADGFLFVSQCDSGNIIYVSDAIQPVLCYSPNEWCHRSLFDFIHVDDLEKVKDQLSSQETQTSGRILDLKTGTVKKEGHSSSVRSHMGSRRGFICRMRIGNYQIEQSNYWARMNKRHQSGNINNTNSLDGNNYSVVHVTGYTKSWPPNSSNNNQIMQQLVHDDEILNSNQFCLIAIARIQVTSSPIDAVNSSNSEFVTRHDQNGMITFVDQRVISILGYQTNDLLKKYLHDFCISQDQNLIKEQLKLLYDTKSSEPITLTLHFTAFNQEIIKFKTIAYAFTNPYNDEFEFIVCTHSLLKSNENSVLLDHQNTQLLNNNSLNSQSNGVGSAMQQLNSTNGTNYNRMSQLQIDQNKQTYNSYLMQPNVPNGVDTYSNYNQLSVGLPSNNNTNPVNNPITSTNNNNLQRSNTLWNTNYNENTSTTSNNNINPVVVSSNLNYSSSPLSNNSSTSNNSATNSSQATNNTNDNLTTNNIQYLRASNQYTAQPALYNDWNNTHTNWQSVNTVNGSDTMPAHHVQQQQHNDYEMTGYQYMNM